MKRKSYYGKVNSLSPLQNVLQEWINAIRRSGKEWLWKDVPWWYNEQACVSTLAAAVWNAGGIALEEYSINKGKERNPLSGRGDLYIKIGRNEFVAEAKLLWPAASRNKATEIGLRLNLWLKEACDDVNNVRLESKERKLGIVFVAPYIPLSRKSEVDRIIDDWLKSVIKVKCSSLAWIFPLEARVIEHEDYIYPGVALLIREVKKKTS